RAFWTKIGEKKQFEIRKDELTEALKSPLKDDKQRTTLTSDFQKAEKLGTQGKYKDAMKALDKLQLDINASIEVKTDIGQIQTLTRELESKWAPVKTMFAAVPPAL